MTPEQALASLDRAIAITAQAAQRNSAHRPRGPGPHPARDGQGAERHGRGACAATVARAREASVATLGYRPQSHGNFSWSNNGERIGCATTARSSSPTTTTDVKRAVAGGSRGSRKAACLPDSLRRTLSSSTPTDRATSRPLLDACRSGHSIPRGASAHPVPSGASYLARRGFGAKARVAMILKAKDRPGSCGDFADRRQLGQENVSVRAPEDRAPRCPVRAPGAGAGGPRNRFGFRARLAAD